MVRCSAFSVSAVSAVSAMLALGAAPARAASTPAPSPIHVDVTADLTSPASGDVITYTLRVMNGSAADYRHLFVFQLLPSGFRVTATTPKAEVRQSGPEWTTDVAAGTTAVFSVTATAGTVADVEHVTNAVRQRSAPQPGASGASGRSDPATASVVTTACARAGSVGPALACGSAKQTLSDAPDDATDASTWRPGLLGLAFLAVLAAGFQGILRRHGSRREARREARRDAQWSGRRGGRRDSPRDGRRDAQWYGRQGDAPDGRRSGRRTSRRDAERAAAD